MKNRKLLSRNKDTKDIKLCSQTRDEKNEIDTWKTLEFNSVVRHLYDDEIMIVASQCHNKLFSNSDVSRLIKNAITQTADAAIKHNVFVKLKDSETIDNKNYYCSTLSFSEDKLRELLSKDENFRFIEIPETIFITEELRNPREEEEKKGRDLGSRSSPIYYINKSLFPLYSIVDDNIYDYYIKYPDNVKSENVTLLLEMRIYIEQKENKDRDEKKNSQIIKQILDIASTKNITRIEDVLKFSKKNLKHEFGEEKANILINLFKEASISGLVIEQKYFLKVDVPRTHPRTIKTGFLRGETLEDRLSEGLEKIARYGVKEVIRKEWFEDEFHPKSTAKGYEEIYSIRKTTAAKNLFLVDKTDQENKFTELFYMGNEIDNKVYHIHNKKPINELLVSYILKGDQKSVDLIYSQRTDIEEEIYKDEKNEDEERKKPKNNFASEYIAKNKTFVPRLYVNFDIRSSYLLNALKKITSNTRPSSIAKMDEYSRDREAFLKKNTAS